MSNAALQSARHGLTRVLDRLGRRAPGLKDAPALHDQLEWAARIGYGARGFVYLSIGALIFLAAIDRVGGAVGSSGAAGWLAGQPMGRVWLVLLGVGLWAFVLWRVLQSVFDADHEGTSAKGLAARAGQALSALFYGLLASTVFEYLDEFGANPAADDVAENQQKAALLLDLPFGRWLLVGVGLAILALAVGNIVRAVMDDFTEALACSPSVCRRVAPLARIGYGARGVAYLPLALLVILAGLQTDAGEVSSFGAALDVLERQPGGSWMLGATALGLMAFGAFAFVEARFRRIRPPRDLNPLN